MKNLYIEHDYFTPPGQVEPFCWGRTKDSECPGHIGTVGNSDCNIKPLISE